MRRALFTLLVSVSILAAGFLAGVPMAESAQAGEVLGPFLPDNYAAEDAFTYVVKRGDTLYGVAIRFGVSADANVVAAPSPRTVSTPPLNDAVTAGTFDRFDQPIRVQQEMTARPDLHHVLVAAPQRGMQTKKATMTHLDPARRPVGLDYDRWRVPGVGPADTAALDAGHHESGERVDAEGLQRPVQLLDGGGGRAVTGVQVGAQGGPELAHVGGGLHVVADDENSSYVFGPDGATRRIALLPGELPDKKSARKKHKADFEILVDLPDPGLLTMGSGSRATRVAPWDGRPKHSALPTHTPRAWARGPRDRRGRPAAHRRRRPDWSVARHGAP